jgi:hypothetical protein
VRKGFESIDQGMPRPATEKSKPTMRSSIACRARRILRRWK